MPQHTIELDETSLRILDLLQQNADISNAELAERVGLSTSPCWRRVTEMKEKGVLRGAVMLADPLSLGLAVNVFVHVSLKQQDKVSLRHFTDAISERPEVMECYLMTGESDFLLRVVVENLQKISVADDGLPDADRERIQYSFQLRLKPGEIHHRPANAASQNVTRAIGGVFSLRGLDNLVAHKSEVSQYEESRIFFVLTLKGANNPPF